MVICIFAASLMVYFLCVFGVFHFAVFDFIVNLFHCLMLFLSICTCQHLVYDLL